MPRDGRVVKQLVDAARPNTQPLAGGVRARRLRPAHVLSAFGYRPDDPLRGPIGREEERFVNAVLQPLWDLQLVVGHQIRELSDFDDLDTGNTEFLLAVLDARPVAGDDEPLSSGSWPASTGFTTEDRARAIDALLELIEQRQAQFNGTIYQLEPDIKNAPGGLRDIAAIRYLQTLGGDRLERSARGPREWCRRRRTFCCACAVVAARRKRPRRQRADARAAGARRGCDGMRRRRVRASVSKR